MIAVEHPETCKGQGAETGGLKASGAYAVQDDKAVAKAAVIH